MTQIVDFKMLFDKLHVFVENQRESMQAIFGTFKEQSYMAYSVSLDYKELLLERLLSLVEALASPKWNGNLGGVQAST